MEQYERVRVESLNREEAELLMEMFSSRAWKALLSLVLHPAKRTRLRRLVESNEIQEVYNAQGGVQVIEEIERNIASFIEERINERSESK